MYEDLPEGLSVTLREEDGRDIIVVNARLTRVERRRAREVGMHMLRERRTHILIPAAAVAEWVQRLRECAPVARGPAVMLAGGAMAMSLAASTPMWIDEDHRPRPGARLAMPAATAEARATTPPPIASTPARATTRPTPSARPAVRAATAGPARPHPTRSAARATPKAARPSSTPTRTRSTQEAVRHTNPPKTHEAAVAGSEKVAPATRTRRPEPLATVTRRPDPPDVDTSLPEVEQPTTRLSGPVPSVRVSLPEPPLRTGNCDGLVDVELKSLPKVCVGG
ncbi:MULTISPECIES: hypothetical protein [unclassified Nonomuraea]|uniref:hypothetical protein n=1 Tax=unclassified Nonomuraea TaxID=2593643 RepID=UPI00340D5D7A